MSVPIRSRVVLIAAVLLAVAGVHPAAAGSADSPNFTIDLRQAVELEVTVDPSPKTVGVLFPVTLTARDSLGATVPVSGMLHLSAPPGRPSREFVWLEGGTTTFLLKLDTPAVSVTLSVEGSGLSGQSVPFQVQGVQGGCNLVWVNASIFDIDGAPVSGGTVELSSGDSCTTDGYGTCQLAGVSPGIYEAWAVVNNTQSQHLQVVVDCNPTNSLSFQVVGEGCNPWGLTPVMLVPGIMGSTTKCLTLSPYPKLTRGQPGAFQWWCLESQVSFHGLLDPYRMAGWQDLVDAFKSVHPGYKIGCTLFPTPYDWRLDASDAAESYLVPKIDEAKLKAGTNTVNVVAHSMGGIVTRAYIASDDFSDRRDIDKLIMVGTPNHGSPVAYFLWEGGDPILADCVSEKLQGEIFGVLDFYRVTARNLHSVHYGPRHPIVSMIAWPLNEIREAQADFSWVVFRDAYKKEILQLAHEHVPSLRLLLPTGEFDFLRLPDGSRRGLTIGTNVNQSLEDINLDTTRLTSPDDPDASKVRTMVFASNNVNTLEDIEISAGPPNSAVDFYEDGTPLVDQSPLSTLYPLLPLLINSEHIHAGAGDGTVGVTSAQLPPAGFVAQDKGKHSGTVGAYKNEIVTLLTGMTPPASAVQSAVKIGSQVLTVGAEGRVQPLVIDPASYRSGVEPGTSLLLQEIPGTQVSLDSVESVVMIGNPAQGEFIVRLAGAYAEDFVVSVEYGGDTETFSEQWGAYFGGQPFEFSFSLDATSETPITFDFASRRPSNLIADYAGGLTDLSWEASLDPGVVGYRIYSKVEGEASLQPVGTAAGLNFATSHPWAASDATPTRLYAVAAFDSDGRETFLSQAVRNNDRDHDGRTDQEEMDRGTDPSNPDTDSDGLTDGEEAYYGTDPFDDDSDGDGFGDYEEVRGGTDPLDAASTPLIFSDGFEVGSWAEWSSAVQ